MIWAVNDLVCKVMQRVSDKTYDFQAFRTSGLRVTKMATFHKDYKK